MTAALKRVLLVEDNEDDIDLTLLSFKKNRIPHEVIVKRDGAAALDYLLGTGSDVGRDVYDQPVVVFLDINLPKISGIEVLKRLRHDARTKRLAVVMLTSSIEEKDLLTCYDLGVNSYVRKPVELEHFNNVVKTLGFYWISLNELPASERKP